MGFYQNVVVPRLVTCACSTKPVLKQRQKVVPKAHGTVLEIGFGSGQNLPHYNPQSVTRVIGVDPCETSLHLAKSRIAQVPFPVEVVASGAEEIPLGDNFVDSALLTFSLCTIADPEAALGEVRRILKPGGELLFCEHGIAPDAGVQRWQHRLNPAWRKLMGGCNLNRDVTALIAGNGFGFEQMNQMYLPNTPRFISFNSWGIAVPDDSTDGIAGPRESR